MKCGSRYTVSFVALAMLLFIATPLFAQQTGTISGKVSATDGSLLPGVTVEARSPALPGPRVVVTGANGEYRLPALPPGQYTVTFTLSGMQTITRQAMVQFGQEVIADATLAVQGVSETVTVTAEASLIDKNTASITSGLSFDQIRSLPVGTEYRDLIKLIPGVQVTPDGTRGPSAGGNGQDNVYNFDGVNVTLPLFGTLSAEPAAHDIQQVSIVKGGARAINFDRSGGFSIDTVSRSGTSEYKGELSYKFQNKSLTADVTKSSALQYDQTKSWTDLNFGGPIAKDRAFFYASYYRPDVSRANQANVYGALPSYQSTRNEGFIKATLTPAHGLLFNASYRDSHRLDTGSTFGAAASSTTGSGNEAWLKIGNADGSWVINSRSYVDFKFTHFANEARSRPDNVANVGISTAIGTQLDVNSLDSQGLLSVPKPISGQTAYNAFIQPLIDRYGYLSNGVRVGGGAVGFGTTFDEDNFYRTGGQFGYNLTLDQGTFTHNIHAGYQRYVDSEDLIRSSNGWGLITVPGGRLNFQGTPIFYETEFQQQGFGSVAPKIHSEYHSQSFEFNDAINWQNWTFNAGLIISNDTLYGQGLRNDSSTLSGYVLSPGTKYEMYNVPFKKMIQPRLGATWAYNGTDTVYVSYAKYNPAASSLPRAASWDRNLATTIQAYFDASGKLFAVDPVKSSSGKLFVPDMTPRTIHEILVGTSKEFSPRLTGRLYMRYRKGSHFWEDTNNTAREDYNPPPGIPQTPYIPDLNAMRAQIGSGSSYVIAELDGAYTKYYEVTAESEYRSGRVFARGTYTWSHYYGNFDQDGSTTTNDANIFIGSSFIADGAGRQLWNNRNGDLHGDRPHVLKLYGSYTLDWNASVGAFIIAQSGTPWEAWSYEPYKSLTTSTSDTSRYAEPAGSRRTPAHWQTDLNYTQNIRLTTRYNIQLTADLFNIFNKQTGYNPQQSVHSALFGDYRSFYPPRILQVAARILF